MKHYADMTEQERAAYKVQREQEAHEMMMKRREDYKKHGQELATLQDKKAEIFAKAADFMKANNGKQFTKRTADALSKELGGITVHKVSDWSESLYIYIPDEARRYSYEETRVIITMQLDTCKRIQGERMADLLTHWAEGSRQNAASKRAASKELDRAIKDAAKVREVIKAFRAKYSGYTLDFCECDITK